LQKTLDSGNFFFYFGQDYFPAIRRYAEFFQVFDFISRCACLNRPLQ
jgi:hypothetical protein